MTQCDQCTQKQRITYLEEELKKNDAAHDIFLSELSALKNRSDLLEYKFSQIMDKLTEVQKALNELQSKPAKRYEQVVTLILQWLVLALMAGVTLF